MRMKCPNCGAQYEVDNTVIPVGGRDVQCSNCGHTWFQRQDQQEAEIAKQQAATADPADAGDTPTAQTNLEAEAGDSQATSEPGAPADADAAPPARQKIDQEVVNILREEAELETSQRSEIPPAPDLVPDLAPAPDPSPEPAPGNLQQAGKPEPDFAERSAQLHGPGNGPDATSKDYDSNRKALLPDIEEINSTLAATDGEQGDETDAAKELRRRSGFRRGFSLAVVVFAILALVYVFAPNIADAAPGTATALASYVDWVNSLRASVDGIMQGAVQKLTSILSQINNDQAS